MRKYSVLLCGIISVLFLVIATLLYPSGSIFNKKSVGFNWSENFFSNLFLSKALNGNTIHQELGIPRHGFQFNWKWAFLYSYLEKINPKTYSVGFKFYRHC
jgi:hypothetical protein